MTLLLLLTAVMALAPFSYVIPAYADGPNVPYDLPVQLPPSGYVSPAVDPNAPYTPLVLSLLAQLMPDNPPTVDQLANAAKLIGGRGTNPTCFGTGYTAPTIGTTPSITPLCWADAQGILNTSGPNQRGSTGPMTLMGLASSMDLDLANVWGFTEGREARQFMITGIYGPQGDIDRLPNWGRNLTTTGEDPFLSYTMVAAQVHGMQAAGAMSQMKHFGVYNGQNQNNNTDIQDQAMREMVMAPYEGGYVAGKAAAAMCSYAIFRDTSLYLPAAASSLWPASPFATGTEPLTWPNNESHFSCEQPLLNYILRYQWGSHAYIATDYGAIKSVAGIYQGTDQEMPSNLYYNVNNPNTLDPTGNTCADAAGNPVACSDPGAIRVGGIPGPGCPARGCGLVNAILNGTAPLSIFKQAIARILYQQERFGMLGCDDNPVSPLCTNPGGVNGIRTGREPLPDGPTSGIPVPGTKNGGAAIVEKYSEMGATLLRNADNALPLTSADLAGGILVTGSSANHTVADPTNEASLGFRDRNAVNPLQQLKALSGNSSAFTFVPANDPTGQPVSPSVLSTTPDAGGLGGLSLSIDGGAPVKDTTPIDHTAVNGNQLEPNHIYVWSGYLYVPTSDTYTFAIQQSDTLPTTLNCPQTGQFGSTIATPTQTLCSAFTSANQSQTNYPPDAVSFSFDGVARNLNAVTANIYGASVPSNPTNAGYTDPLMIGRTCATGNAALEPGTTNCTAAQSNLVGGTFYPVSITVNTTTCVSTPAAAAVGGNPAVPAVVAPCGPTSFRFAYSRAAGDIADAAAAAVGKSKAIVFVDTGVGTSSTIPNPYGSTPPTISAVKSLSPQANNLISAVVAANPNTIVVLYNDNPVLTPWIGGVKSMLVMWFAGQEGGTSTARLLLGQANPSGHSSLTWPKNATDTIWAYNQPEALYPGDTPGPHLERLNNGPNSTTIYSEGIYMGYRYFDKLGIEPQFAFGHGLTYTNFEYRNLVLKAEKGGTVRVSFIVQNKGNVTGTAVPQVYVGPAPNVPGYVQQPVRALRGYSRVELRPNEAKRVEITLDTRSFEYWDEQAQGWVTAPGVRTIWVGESSRDLRLSDNVAPAKK